MATAQVDAWVGVHRGAIDSVARAVDTSLADAALARMMLYRRRAIVAEVVGAFLRRVGGQFQPYLDGRMPDGPVDRASELAKAKAACDIAGSLCVAPPLLFERALLAEADGRPDDARSDLELLLSAYPGFVPAAVTSARVALAAGDPAGGIRSLATVEREIIHIREGASLLADAMRAVGLCGRASRYDLAALISHGYHDSRGNDCAPVDVAGASANDGRMPQIFYFESQPDGSIVCNSRGIYCHVNQLFGWLLLAMNHQQPVSAFRRLSAGGTKPRKGAMALAAEGIGGRLRLLLAVPGPYVSTLRSLVGGSEAVWRQSSEIDRTIISFIVYWGRRLGAMFLLLAAFLSRLVAAFCYRLYKMLPAPVRTEVIKLSRFSLGKARSLAWRLTLAGARRLGPHLASRLREIPDRNARLRLAQDRYHSGLSRIFGLPMMQAASGSNDTAARASDQRASTSDGAVSSFGPSRWDVPAAGELPPAAMQVFSQLVREAYNTGADITSRQGFRLKAN